MKRFLPVVLAVLILFSCAACSGNKNDQSSVFDYGDTKIKYEKTEVFYLNNSSIHFYFKSDKVVAAESIAEFETVGQAEKYAEAYSDYYNMYYKVVISRTTVIMTYSKEYIKQNYSSKTREELVQTYTELGYTRG
ncbi:MAG: hypothetical protein Q4B04_02955 [bacterium]|nr:hypothetical protein [bacterium]